MTTIQILKFTDQDYSPLLRQICSPPQKLYCKGNIKILQKPCIAIVGTRRNSDYGEEMTEKIIEELKILDIAIVSGLAKGIDTIAHKAAIKNNLSTISVLGSGIKNIYPRQNDDLAAEIIKNNGLIISEYAEATEPLKSNFPQRNRIISGLSMATIVIEAPEKSGALITAKLALEQNREVFVVPGDVDRILSQGCLKLLQRSEAYPIGSGKDIIDILKKQPHLFQMSEILNSRESKFPKFKSEQTVLPYKLTPIQTQFISIFSKHRGLTMDKIVKQLKLPINQILTTISMLEINNFLISKDGKYYRKC